MYHALSTGLDQVCVEFQTRVPFLFCRLAKASLVDFVVNRTGYHRVGDCRDFHPGDASALFVGVEHLSHAEPLALAVEAAERELPFIFYAGDRVQFGQLSLPDDVRSINQRPDIIHRCTAHGRLFENNGLHFAVQLRVHVSRHRLKQRKIL